VRLAPWSGAQTRLFVDDPAQPTASRRRGRAPHTRPGRILRVPPPSPKPNRTDPAYCPHFCSSPTSTTASRRRRPDAPAHRRVDPPQHARAVPRPDDIERERGIRSEARRMRLPWSGWSGKMHVLNLIDTPATSTSPTRCRRSLAACEGACPRRRPPRHRGPDAWQPVPGDGEQPHRRPVLNKIDLPAAQPEKYAAELGAHHRLRGGRRPPRECQDRSRASPTACTRSWPHPASGRGAGRAGAGDDLRLGLRQLSGWSPTSG